ncbi:hypothetical protein GCM10011452_17970 [Gemmobacter lanyuensis]|uniref:Uncharacterized protein n=1 Tax=Gemmobacter lanyuensis TaxID=1054497 RepID=A0A918ISD4_9RHOB|nr:hypothetical protein [Gemmobacter lanyuensis]GGW29793.1 hypothetical protein GCM10011452_17970 [Gemmobacter lanyuensis]
MSELVVKAAYATVATEEGAVFVGFVDGREENYALFRQPVGGGAVWFEVNDEDFGAEDAIAAVATQGTDLLVTLRPEKAGRFGYASQVAVRLKTCDGAEAALAQLQKMGLPGL